MILVRPLKVVGDFAYVPLTKNYSAIIDAEDAELIGQYNWCATEEKRKDGSICKVYAKRSIRTPGNKIVTQLMHKLILPIESGYEVDHIDGNSLNNRKTNLRKCTRSENARNCKIKYDNKTGVKVVCWAKHAKKFVVKIRFKGKQKHLGYFSSIDEAAEEYAKWSKELHGSFGRVS